MISIEENRYFLQPGYIFVSREPYLVHTVLGSCVSVCLWDSFNRFGGMNHYVYSESPDGERNGRFGNIAIPYLIQLMLESGAQMNNLKAHIIGGGQNPSLGSFIGTENAATAEKLLKKSKIEILTRDVLGQFGRKVIFNSQSGEILIYKINEIRRDDWYGKEN